MEAWPKVVAECSSRRWHKSLCLWHLNSVTINTFSKALGGSLGALNSRLVI